MSPFAALDESTFDQALADAGGLVLVDFWADWCGPCKGLAPILEQLSEEYAGRVVFAKVNADENRRLMEAFGIRALPTVVLLLPREGGGADVVGNVVGAQGGVQYVKMIERALNPPPSLIGRLKGIFGKER